MLFNFDKEALTSDGFFRALIAVFQVMTSGLSLLGFFCGRSLHMIFVVETGEGRIRK